MDGWMLFNAFVTQALAMLTKGKLTSSPPLLFQRFFYNLIGVHLCLIEFSGHNSERNTPVNIGSHSWYFMSEWKASQKVRRIVYGPVRQDCLCTGKDISAILKMSKNMVPCIILKWKNCGTTNSLPRSGHPAKQSNWRWRSFARQVTKKSVVTMNKVQSSWLIKVEGEMDAEKYRAILSENLVELEQCCQEEWEKPLKPRCAKLVGYFPRRLEVVNATKGILTKS